MGFFYRWSCALILGMFLSCSAQSTTWLENEQEAFKIAKEQKKPVLIWFTGSDWCLWCIVMDRGVLETSQFSDYAKDSLVVLKADFPKSTQQSDGLKKQNNGLKQKFGPVEGYPSFVLVNSDGKKLLTLTGYQEGGPQAFIDQINQALIPGYTPKDQLAAAGRKISSLEEENALLKKERDALRHAYEDALEKLKSTKAN